MINLMTNWNRRVLLFIETTNHFGRTLVEGINHFALEHDWLVIFEQRGQYDPIVKRFKPWNVDGIISRTFHRSMLDEIRESALPMVELVGGVDPRIPIEVTMDEDRQARMVFDHFHERGLRHFAYYGMEDAPCFRWRRQSFVDYVKSNDFICEVCPMSWTQSDYILPRWKEKYRSLLRHWLLDLPKPVGIYAGIDYHAKMILEVCRESDIAVPDEVSVVGVENDEWFCRMQRPTLSSVDTSGHTIGYVAASLLNEKMNGTYTTRETILVPSSFISIRQSSDHFIVDDSDIQDALRFIRENACRQITVEDVSNTVGISRRTLYRGFCKHLNRTPQDEIIRVQIERAKILLRETNLLISSVAAKTGFTTAEYFVRAFRRECGLTPNKYRTQCRFHTVDMEQY